ncbi:MAG: helix-turn-helix domain-containing protein [Phycisphaerae bacterium]
MNDSFLLCEPQKRRRLGQTGLGHAAADGYSYTATARQVGSAIRHVRKWAKRFLERGLAGLRDDKRTDRPTVFFPEVALHLVKMACERISLIWPPCRSG